MSFLYQFKKMNFEFRTLKSLICKAPSCIQQCLLVQSAMLYEDDASDFQGLWKSFNCINTVLHLELRKLARSKLACEEAVSVSIPAAPLVVTFSICQQIVLILCFQFCHLYILIGHGLSVAMATHMRKNCVG